MPRMIATYEPELKSKTIRKLPLSIGDRFRANVRRLMKERSVSNKQLAEWLNAIGKRATEDSVRLLLKSDSFPSTEWIELLARVFEVPEEEITE